MTDRKEPNERPAAPREDVVMQRSASSVIFQTADAIGDVGLGAGTALLGAAAWKATGSKTAEPQRTPPPPPAPPANETE